MHSSLRALSQSGAEFLQFIVRNMHAQYSNVQIGLKFAAQGLYVGPLPSLMVPSAAIRLSAALFVAGKDREWVTVTYSNPRPSKDDWIGVFSPANFKYKLIHYLLFALVEYCMLLAKWKAGLIWCILFPWVCQ